MSLCPAIIYLLKVSNRTTIKRYEICSRLTINTSERPYWRSSGAFIVYFEHISYLLLCFYCWLWKSKCLVGGFLIPNFEKIQHVNIVLLLLTMSMYLSSELLLLFLHNRALRQNVVVITKTFDQKSFVGKYIPVYNRDEFVHIALCFFVKELFSFIWIKFLSKNDCSSTNWKPEF